ncbi:MAG: OsmC family protein [Bacteroidota bacterium]
MDPIKHHVVTTWTKGRAFETSTAGHSIIIDTDEHAEQGAWPSPKRLLLSSLAGCTGVDVIDLLKKMRVTITGFEMDTEADLSDKHPKVYTVIRLIYRFYGENLDRKKIEKAVKLSKEKYCGVSAMLEKNCPIEVLIEYYDSQ